MFSLAPRHHYPLGPVLSSLGLAWFVVACQSGQTITLGRGLGGEGGDGDLLPSIQVTASNPSIVTELSDPEKDDNPTLTADELEICLTSKREGGLGGSDIWCARRATRESPFGPLNSITLLSTEGFDTSPALALDGLSLWFGSRPDEENEDEDENESNIDIFESTRSTRDDAWSEPRRISELSSELDDIPRPVAMNDTVMPLGSRRNGNGYQTYLSERNTPDTPFAQPTAIEELVFDDIEIVDAFLTEDGKLLVFSRVDEGEDNPGELYYAYRETLSLPFSAPQELSGANSDEDDRDPWLSIDGKRLYFSSNRGGDFEIYMADIEITAREQ